MAMLTRVAKLERENIELQEEILSLKQQLKVSLTCTTPTKHNEELEEVIKSLKNQVMMAVEALKIFRTPLPSPPVHEGRKVLDVQPDRVPINSGNIPKQESFTKSIREDKGSIKTGNVPRLESLNMNSGGAEEVIAMKSKRIDDIDFDDFFNDLVPPTSKKT